MRDFDYKYPIGFGRSVSIEDLVIDYAAAPQSEAQCWLLGTVPFSQTSHGARLFFPTRIDFRNIQVRGRDRGVRLLRAPNPQSYDLGRTGGYDGSVVAANCTIAVEDVQLERLNPARPGDTDNVHLLIGSAEAADYADPMALYPRIRFRDCEGVTAYLGNCAADAIFDQCSLNTITAPGLQGGLSFANCRFQPNLQEAEGDIYTLDATLGTRLVNCAILAPVIDGEQQPEFVNRSGIIEINGPVRGYHINTALGNHVINYCAEAGITFDPAFIEKLKLHHALEE
jgi:hypothetical protein